MPGVRPLQTRTKPAPRRAKAAAETPAPDIIQALVGEHKYQARLLNTMERQVGLLNQRLPPDWDVMHGVMRYMTQYPDRFHHPKEDLLFEKIALRDPSTRSQIDQMLEEHRTIIAKGADLLAEIDRHREGAHGADPNRLRKLAHAYTGSLRRHMDVETLRLFPLAVRALQPRDWIEVERRMKPILDPVFGEAPADEFKELREAEAARPQGFEPGRLAAGLIEAAALLEAVEALIGAGSRMRRDLLRHNRETLRVNRDLIAQGLALLPWDERTKLMRELMQRNVQMLLGINFRMLDLWSEALGAAFRPYEQPEGPYTPKLLRWRRKPVKPHAAKDSGRQEAV